MDDSSDRTERGKQREGSWFRRRRRAVRRSRASEHEKSAPAGPGPMAEQARLSSSAVPSSQPQPTAIWTDSHCHLQDDTDPAATLALARAARVGRVVCVGTDAASSRRAVFLANELSGKRPPAPSAGPAQAASAQGTEVWATVGLHPHDAKNGLGSVTEFLDELSAGEGLRQSRVVAIGECGLDYHYEHSPRTVQRDIFAAQVELANIHNLALVIHTREAWDDTFSILEDQGVPDRTIFHCFTGGEPEATQCLRLGALLSFSGIVTFANAGELREVVAHCPLDRLLVETDSPFLTPVPYRGRRNSPSNVVVVGNTIGQLKGFAPEVTAAVSWLNAEKAFGLGV
ncbi:MAG: TatD family hydrolase [Acidimicrobiales bacterium]